MAAVETMTSRTVHIVVNQSPEGVKEKALKISMGKMSKTYWNAEDAMDVAEAIGPLFRFDSMGYLTRAQDYRIVEGE